MTEKLTLTMGQVEAVRKAGEDFAKHYPEKDREEFMKEFMRLVVPMEDAIQKRLNQLELDAIPLIEAIVPYDPGGVAQVVNQHVTEIRAVVGAVINKLMAIRIESLRIDLLDATMDCLKEVREAVVEFDRKAREKQGDKAS